MGRQILFHMLPEDMQTFLQFVQERNPIVITRRSSDSPEIRSIPDPPRETEVMTIWNKALLNSLERILISYPGRDYYGIDESLPTLELCPSKVCEWNGSSALLQGRIYGFFDKPTTSYERWYNSIVHWIRAHFAKNTVMHVGGYIGPSALKWFREGGILLPMLEPPPTAEWVSFVKSQHSCGSSVTPR